MKLNWGVGIFAAYVVFMIVVLGTVAFTTTVDVDLVADDYYEQELKYQNEIDKKERTRQLSEQVGIKLENENLKIFYPKLFAPSISGKINFYRPADQKLDFVLDIKTDTTGLQFVSTQKLAKGFWKIKVNWFYSGEEYLNEKNIVIN